MIKLCRSLRGPCASPTVGASVMPTEQQDTVPAEQPIYLKPSRSKYRKPSFVFPRMRDHLPSYAYRAPSLSTASPMFCITSPSCEYYALRLPLLKAGFKRLHTHLAPKIPSNLLWGRSLMIRPTAPIKTDAGNTGGAVQLTSPHIMGVEGVSSTEALQMVCAHQRFNHFPRTYSTLGCKLGLAQRLHRVKKSLEREGVKRDVFDFFPQTWIFPEQKESLMKAMDQARPTQRFIWKPARGSCGKGIFVCPGGEKNSVHWKRVLEKMERRVLTSPSLVNRSYVVQEYVDDPLLLEGRKMDLRLYVAVTSYDPLTVYLHDEGLVRLAVQQYNEGAPDEATRCDPVEVSLSHFDPFRDLTNYSIGRKWVKKGKQFGSSEENLEDADLIASEERRDIQALHLKKSMEELWNHIDSLCPVAQQRSVSTICATEPPKMRTSDHVWNSIAQVIVKTLLAVKSTMSKGVKSNLSPGSFFELYGFDMMLDSSLKPWLVEVNTLPSLASTSTFDYTVKTNIISDLLNLAMIEPFERPLECLKGVIDEQRLHSMGLCDSLTLEAAESVHRWKGHHRSHYNPTQLGDLEKREEVWLRLQDELAYCRGFRRIFPPLLTSHSTSFPLADVDVLAPHVNLTKADMWALEA
ncbi:tubulin-tyrosine ligase-like protein, conserved [Trypanosoma brucei brucei TREU927]|uniref:Tubulin-tyrosine ligase-like protein, conserved n=1 Tax=Trypanosoma brucei brucei (strain 927/4 GUTat10.1) TaxID=185431 RepID=Q584Z7_TRYB2|nr:tubulin-tyrosine ligase-like protein, conserved [Trypanosoma brucei brucei TREU927]AAX79925.1 tubulin-tyrosine ligase-like protein, conserved [Trypanosoma brucei]AAZ11916.1 tubulin-tyrosine ligase-like protein, conserved [Trypanosoma brucei brucei TREU927]